MQYFRHKRITVAVAAVIAVVLWGMGERYFAYADLKKRADENALPAVSVMAAKAGVVSEEIVFPANIQAWHEAPIFARTNGYLKAWYTDIGTEVKEGDLIAEIETPEIDAQLSQAEADLHTAEANSDLAETTAKRWKTLLKTNSVSRQEADEKAGDAKAKAALTASARANYERLRQLESFKKITAPFSGTITARNVDNGALINAGGGANAAELFHIADIHKLRVYVQLPQTYTLDMKPGATADLYLSERPGKVIPVTLTKNAGALDPATRTLLLEFELENKDILSGGYGEVHIKAASGGMQIKLPVNVLLFRSDGLRVAAVDKNNRIDLKTVTINRDFGNEVEINSGIAPGEKIVLNPSDSLTEGQKVRIVNPENIR